MAQYIDKAALVAEIEKRIADGKIEIKHASHKHLEYYFEGYEDGLVLLKEQFLDTLEVREVKEPTASDRGMAEEIIINLKRVEQDYHIDLTREMEWIRNKAQKGEVEL